MTGMALAIERRQWQLVSLYLLLGVSEAASLLPRESLDELLDLLSAAPPPPRRPAPEDGRGR